MYVMGPGSAPMGCATPTVPRSGIYHLSERPKYVCRASTLAKSKGAGVLKDVHEHLKA